jgi:D-tyrosyl-tRNA(Tyr) deacylase
MKAIIQRVKSATVTVEGVEIASIGQGLLTLLGVQKGDDEAKLHKLIDKILNLRCFEDEAGKMNLSLKNISGEHLIVSQFTLLADCSKGTRPSFTEAETPEKANALYEQALRLSAESVKTCAGKFGAHMDVKLNNDGPVTIILEV